MALAKLKGNKVESSNRGSYHECQIHTLSQMIHSSNKMRPTEKVERATFKVLRCRAVTIYGVDESLKEIYLKATYGNKLGKIRVSISTKSVAGYVVMIKKMVNIEGLKDIGEIRSFLFTSKLTRPRMSSNF